jgi:hypothetical protein
MEYGTPLAHRSFNEETMMTKRDRDSVEKTVRDIRRTTRRNRQWRSESERSHAYDSF